ncbi:MAG: hypothetical protein Q8N26_25170 [Myxococcales bacterium]|nr:hypothetical protein [Myxococcales bacterium]
MTQPEVKATLQAATWVPKVARERALRILSHSTESAKALLTFALETGSVEAVQFWSTLQDVHLPKDPNARLSPALQRHLVTVAGARSVRPAKLLAAIEAVRVAPPDAVPAAQAALLALGQGISLANAHGIYVSAARKAPITALPTTPPHLAGPLPELSIYETVELAIGLARVATQKRPSDECDELIARAERVLTLARAGTKSAALAADKTIPAPSKPKGPAFTLARAALKEAWTTDHVSGRGTSIKAGVIVGLELGDPAWWLSQVDEQVMRGDARTAWERKELSTSSPIVHLVWRGGDKTSRLWLTRLESGRYALLAKLGRSWTNTEGDLSSVTATIPDAWFARAMAVVESRR